MYEERAELLGRLGRHEKVRVHVYKCVGDIILCFIEREMRSSAQIYADTQALELYAIRLRSPEKAEAYCTSHFASDPSVYLSLLKVSLCRS